MEANLIYVFITTAFSQKGEIPLSWCAHTSLPDYYVDTFNFNHKKFTNSYVLMERSQIDQYKDLFPKTAKLICIEDEIVPTEEFQTIQSIIDTQWHPRYMKDVFWYLTFIRVLVLSIFIKKYNLQNVIHVEADNLIFADNYQPLFDVLNSGEFGYCNECPHASAPALIAFKDGESASNLIKHHITLLKKGEHVLNHYVGHFVNYITDMAFLDIIYRAKKNYKMLPCLPLGPFSENFDKLQHVFDPTSYGQYLGGTNNNHPPGHVDVVHYVGKEIHDNIIKVGFDTKPYIIYNDTKIPIFNLHVHNKKAIKQFIC